MCVVSNMGDHYNQKFNQPDYTNFFSNIQTGNVTRSEFEAVKKELEEMKAILKRAKLYDQQTGQPDCEMEEKVVKLKEIAKLMGVDLSEVFK